MSLPLADLVARARSRLSGEEFRPAVERLRGEAAALEAETLAAPLDPAGWYHDFFCPEHGVQLEFALQRPQHHRCPATGHLLTGPAFDAAARWFISERLSRGAFTLALAGAILDQRSCREAAIGVLEGYAARYPGYPVHGQWQGQGRATGQSLDEAVWIIPLLWAYALVRDGLTVQRRRHIERALLIPATEHLVGQCRPVVHNVECWHRAAILTAGEVLDRADWIEEGIGGAFGLEAQLEMGVRGDGLWFEVSPSYHFYALWALLWAARAHPPLVAQRKLRPMFEAPVRLAFADLRLPALNDCWSESSLLGHPVHGAPTAEAFYEVGHGWYESPETGWLLSEIYRRRPRASIEALLHGSDQRPEGRFEAERRKSVLFPRSGLALLRAPGPAATELLVKYGPHGGGHGHPDKLSLSLFAQGEPLSVDLGTGGYGDRARLAWHRGTWSHNTLVVDGRSQPPATGELLDFRSCPEDGTGFGVIDCVVQWPEGTYQSVRVRRILLVRPGYVIDLVSARADRDRTFDLMFRGRGETCWQGTLVDPGQGEETVGDLPRVRRLSAEQAPEIVWRTGRAGLAVRLSSGDGAVYLGGFPSSAGGAVETTLVRRQSGPGAEFAAVLHPFGPTPSLEAVSFVAGGMGRWRIAVQIAGVVERWTVDPERADPPPEEFHYP
jgi:hypothetical protein